MKILKKIIKKKHPKKTKSTGTVEKNQKISEERQKKIDHLEKLRKQRVALVMEATGWDEAHVKDEMARVKEMGFNQVEYMRNECWKLSDEEIVKLINRRDSVAKREELLKDPVEFVCYKTGWDKEKAEEKINNAVALGISEKQYANYEMFDLSDEEVEEFAGVIKEKKAISLANKRFYIKTAVQKSGWTEEAIKDHMKVAKAKGITAFQYAKNLCWLCDDEGLDKVSKRLKGSKKHTAEIYREKIMEATSWSRAKLELEVGKAKNICECSYEDYFVFKLYELTPEQQKEYVTLDLFSKMRVKYNNRDTAIEVLDDKVAFNKTFADCINRKWFYNRDLPYEEFLEIVKDIDAVLVKPLKATQGKGIIKIDCRVPDEEKRSLYDRIMSQKASIVEQYIVQHDDVMAFCPTSVNTLRITTLNAHGKCNFLYAVFRMGRGAVVDNFHAGGIACAVDMKTGITTTHAVDLDGNVFPENPYSGLKTKGFQIPHWDKIIETCEKAYDRVDGVNLIGWDFAITSDGVDLIEGNPGASYVVAQIPYIQDRIGLRSVMIGDFLD